MRTGEASPPDGSAADGFYAMITFFGPESILSRATGGNEDIARKIKIKKSLLVLC